MALISVSFLPIPSSTNIEWFFFPLLLFHKPPNIPVTSATSSTRNSQRGKSQSKRGWPTWGADKRRRIRAYVGNAKSPVADSSSQPDNKSELGTQPKKGWNRDINPSES